MTRAAPARHDVHTKRHAEGCSRTWRARRLANDALALKYLAALLAVMGAVGLATAIEHTSQSGVRAVAGAPLASALGVAVAARIFRARADRLWEGSGRDEASGGGAPGARRRERARFRAPEPAPAAQAPARAVT